jgi:signal transduction histidine kinase
MRRRAFLVGGKLDIDSSPGRGTAILAWVPLNEERSMMSAHSAE